MRINSRESENLFPRKWESIPEAVRKNSRGWQPNPGNLAKDLSSSGEHRTQTNMEPRGANLDGLVEDTTQAQHGLWQHPPWLRHIEFPTSLQRWPDIPPKAVSHPPKMVCHPSKGGLTSSEDQMCTPPRMHVSIDFYILLREAVRFPMKKRLLRMSRMASHPPKLASHPPKVAWHPSKGCLTSPESGPHIHTKMSSHPYKDGLTPYQYPYATTPWPDDTPLAYPRRGTVQGTTQGTWPVQCSPELDKSLAKFPGKKHGPREKKTLTSRKKDMDLKKKRHWPREKKTWTSRKKDMDLKKKNIAKKIRIRKK